MVAVSKMTRCLFYADLGCVLPDSVWLIRKLILSNGLFGSVARVATCLCAVMNDNRGFGRFCFSGKPAVIFPALSVIFLNFIVLPQPRPACSLLCFLALHLVLIFSLFVSLPRCLSLFLFLLASPPLRCQHFTVDIQLLAGHSIVIPFRAAPFSAGPQTAIQITSSAGFRVAALQNVVFKHFWGHHLI